MACCCRQWGRVLVDGTDTKDKSARRVIRRKVGLVFQYPEHQLFEETVAKDVAFGPQNLGLTAAEIEDRVHDALVTVDFRPASTLSGRLLICPAGGDEAGGHCRCLGHGPSYLVLDEPTAGLDPRGRDEILGQIAELQQQQNLTVLLVSHSMEDVARLVDRLIIMYQGQIVATGSTRELYQQAEQLKELGLGIPQITEFMRRLHHLSPPGADRHFNCG